ncbi:MAG: hypothetical protein ACMXYF_05735 [Candidatus Woesearchaeota archaeon]
MVSITLGVDEQTRKLMKKFSHVNWSGFVRDAIREKTSRLSKKEELLAKLRGESVNQDVILGKKVNESVAKRLKKENLL